MTSTSGGEGLIIPDHVQILGETGHFYTVVTVEAENQEAFDDEDEDEEEDEEEKRQSANHSSRILVEVPVEVVATI